jgi:hypothetical protein
LLRSYRKQKPTNVRCDLYTSLSLRTHFNLLVSCHTLCCTSAVSGTIDLQPLYSTPYMQPRTHTQPRATAAAQPWPARIRIMSLSRHVIVTHKNHHKQNNNHPLPVRIQFVQNTNTHSTCTTLTLHTRTARTRCAHHTHKYSTHAQYTCTYVQ